MRGTGPSALVAMATALGCSPFLDSPEAEFSAGEKIDFTYLKAKPPVIDAFFGYSLSWGGGTLAVTAPFETIPSPSGPIEVGGAVYLFEPDAGSWKQTRLEMPSTGRWDGMMTAQGRPTIYSGIHTVLDARTVFVGVGAQDSGSAIDPSDDSMPEAGAFYAYDRDRPDEQPFYFKAPIVSSEDWFGYALALVHDWLIVGAPGDDRGRSEQRTEPDSGIVYAYPRAGVLLGQPQSLKAPNAGAGDQFGAAIAIEGDTLVIGAPTESSGSVGVDAEMEDESVQSSGAVYTYRLINGIWTYEHYLKPDEPQENMAFGSSLSLSDHTLAVGAYIASGCPGEIAEPWRGAVYIFREQESTWQTEQCLASISTGEKVIFGQDLSLRGDRLLVGAAGDSSASATDPTDGSLEKAGAAYLFRRTEAGSWERQDYLKAPDRARQDLFGASVAIVPGYFAVGAVEGVRAPAIPPAPGDNQVSGPGGVYLFPTEP